MEFQGSGNCGEIAPGINDVEWPKSLEGIPPASGRPYRLRKFAGLELSEMGRRISSLRGGSPRPDFSQTDRIQILLRLSDMGRTGGHQLDGPAGGGDSGHA